MARASRGRYQLVLADWVLPGEVDGLALCRRVREMRDERPHVIVLTVRDRPEEIEQVLQAGADDYLPKPLLPRLVKTRIQVAEWQLAERLARVEAEAARARLASVVEFSDDAIVTMTLDGTITDWNCAAEALFGHSAEEAVGQHVSMLDGDPVEEILDCVRRGMPVRHMEAVRHRKDGEIIEVSVTFSPIRDRAGKLTGVSSILRDISEAKRHERELRAAWKAAARANQAKTAFLSSMSHEVRTPLNAIVGFSDLLLAERDSMDPATMHGTIENVSVAASDLLKLADEMLDLARIEAGRLALHPEEFLVADVIRNAISIVSHQALRKEVRLVGPIALEGDMVADPARVRQILFNLLTNAIKFSPVGGEVRIDVERASDAIVLAVGDLDPGIPAEDIERIFQPFEQVNVGGRAREGTGLGLAIVRELVHAHGGRIHVSSALGQGSRFVVTLPQGGRGETRRSTGP
ncbi:MAG: PAS domain S-box protein [Armatimonadetes bacterium]|nr:PAS domain S-box protein [Armatimonadota bacterium]